MKEPLRKTVHYRPIALRIFIFVSLAMIVGLTNFVMEAVNISDAQTDNEEIHIKADKIMADLDEHEMELLGNVRVTQQKTSVTADKMKVYYQESNSQKTEKSIQGAISKVIAKGNVTIEMDKMVAVTDEATYIKDSEMLTLTGANSKLSSGPNWITGSKIIFFRAQNKLIVEGSAQDQVKALIYAGKTELF
ncbi:MAG: LptA/OstA family protein [Desulfobacterales bacterium]